MVQEDKAVLGALRRYENEVCKVLWRLPEEPKRDGVKRDRRKPRHKNG